ncbi:unnamed protein product, partial [Mesorhabditis spiculigera]
MRLQYLLILLPTAFALFCLEDEGIFGHKITIRTRTVQCEPGCNYCATIHKQYFDGKTPRKTFWGCGCEPQPLYTGGKVRCNDSGTLAFDSYEGSLARRTRVMLKCCVGDGCQGAQKVIHAGVLGSASSGGYGSLTVLVGSILALFTCL